MSDTLPTPELLAQRRKAIARWLYIGVVMTLIQILLGGITRLTGSGLSIAEWKPILGAIPPMNETAWQAAFELYKEKAAGQFINHNSDYTLSDFKSIYFWEWMHREWARVALGGVFIIGFIYFLSKKYFEKWMINPLIILFVLGGLQSAVGWIMVASGLNPDDTHVSHIKLALHFMFALLLLVYIYWFALKLSVDDSQIVNHPILKKWTLAILSLLTIQLVYGAFMAGLKAAPVASTWPDINGAYVPTQLNSFGSNVYLGIQKFTDNPIAVHFIHRTIAYVLIIIIAMWFLKIKKLSTSLPTNLIKAATFSFVLVLAQVILGICTVLNGHLMTLNKFRIFEVFAELHQMVAILLLLSVTYCMYLFKGSKSII
jgi:cytochrome c oxidase assembly protein subunit 15